MSSLRNPPISHTVLHHSEIELEWICGLVKEQELEVWVEGCTERPFAPCTRGSLHRKALPPNTNYYSLLQWRCEWPFSYSGKSRDETGLSYFSPGCEQRLWAKGYKDVVIHVSLLEIVHDGVLIDLAEQHHVIHPAVFDIVALPVVPVVPPAPLQQNTRTMHNC